MTPPKRKRRRRARIVRAPYLVELAKAGLIPTPVEARRKWDVMAAVIALTERDGKPPSAVALARELGISRQKTSLYLAELEGEGLLRDEPVVVRSGKWEVTPEGAAALERQSARAWRSVRPQNGISSSPSGNDGSGASGTPSSSWDLEEEDERDPFEPEPWSKTLEATTSVR